MGTVSFPGLGLEFHLNRVAFHIGSWPVYWYGIIIAAGFLLAVLYCCHAAKRFGIKQDDIIDMLFFAVPADEDHIGLGGHDRLQIGGFDGAQIGHVLICLLYTSSPAGWRRRWT